MSEASPWSYCYLRISRRYGIPYGVVLHHAHAIQHKNEKYCNPQEYMAMDYIYRPMPASRWENYLKDLIEATAACIEIREGKRNPWTGEKHAVEKE